jgi:hemerythrin-like domain-containing protein
MDATTFLTQQHDQVKQWFAECETLAEGDFKRRSELVEQITETLRLHTQIEEEILYPPAKDVDHDLVLEAFEEHHMIRILLEEIGQTPPSNERYAAKLAVLREMVSTHIEEEEGTLFPELKESCGLDKLNEFGTRLQERFKELQQGVSTSR